jgi:hypothetical protein
MAIGVDGAVLPHAPDTAIAFVPTPNTSEGAIDGALCRTLRVPNEVPD